MENEFAIGVFDSGIGGLSVLKQLLKYLPNEKYIYLGDTARVPYGNKSENAVRIYAKECTEFFLEKNVKLIIIACNTVSAVALSTVREIAKKPVIGMIMPAAEAALHTTKNNKIGIIGTRATIKSDAYNEAILNLNENKKNLQIYTKACPLFVPIVEEGWFEHKASKLIAKEYLNEILKFNIDTLVMGCTHYPMLFNLITKITKNIKLIDSGEQAAIKTLKLFAEKNLFSIDSVENIENKIENEKIEFYFTDEPSIFPRMSNSILGFEVKKFNIINLKKQLN